MGFLIGAAVGAAVTVTGGWLWLVRMIKKELNL
jgi:hypothetical protein